MTIVSLENLLKASNGSPLEQLVRQSEDMQRLTTDLKAGLESGVAIHLSSANLRADGQLVLVADSPAWAARLRFESEKLLELARRNGVKVTACKVIVARTATDLL
jgi:hypothetical protein